MGLQRMIECPQCGDRWTVERGVDDSWYDADKCHKCGCIVMKAT